MNKSYEQYKEKLWCDLETDEERIDFLKCGRAVETGIISPAIVQDVIDAFVFCARFNEWEE